MKKIYFTLISALLLGNFQLLMAQWNTNGPDIVWTPDNVGIGTSNPLAKLHINSASGQNGLRVQINGSTKLLVNSNGGVSVGSVSTPPANGLYVSGNIGVGTTAPSANIHIVYPTGVTNHGLLLDNTSSAGVDWKIYAVSTGDLWLQNDGVTKGTFNGTSGVYTPSSDRKFKKNIVAMENVLGKVMQLKPSLYQFNTQENASDRKFIGLIAQEVQPVFPEAVYEHNGKNDGTDDFLTLDYSIFGIIAIKAIQEQQKKITTLEERIAKLEAALTNVSSITRDNAVSKEFIGARLEQNIPNPFNQVTTIRYKIPAGSNAQITIHDQSGKLMKTLKASDSGVSQINANLLTPGTYTYTLSVNGKLIESKKMIIVR
jgi:hypothetical protein